MSPNHDTACRRQWARVGVVGWSLAGWVGHRLAPFLCIDYCTKQQPSSSPCTSPTPAAHLQQQHASLSLLFRHAHHLDLPLLQRESLVRVVRQAGALQHKPAMLPPPQDVVRLLLHEPGPPHCCGRRGRCVDSGLGFDDGCGERSLNEAERHWSRSGLGHICVGVAWAEGTRARERGGEADGTLRVARISS